MNHTRRGFARKCKLKTLPQVAESEIQVHELINEVRFTWSPLHRKPA
jgi:hypothetical protein